MTRVAVLGCGPSGLLAAEAAIQAGADVRIYSKKRRSPIHGAQYIHEPINGVTDYIDPFELTYKKFGTRQGYAAKVYGSPDAPCSWDSFPEGEVLAWSMDEAYARLWNRWERIIIDADLTAHDVKAMLDSPAFDLVVSSIPATAICCDRRHEFPSQQIFVRDKAWLGCDSDTIIYNGDSADHWYRTSSIQGHESTESTQNMEGAWTGIKPLNTTCHCWCESSKWLRVGRFGKWRKGVLVHQAFEEVRRAVL